MKRYDIFYPVPQCSARMEENVDGDYVLWDDVKHLVAPAQQATNSAMDAIPALVNRWLDETNQDYDNTVGALAFARWAREQHQ